MNTNIRPNAPIMAAAAVIGIAYAFVNAIMKGVPSDSEQTPVIRRTLTAIGALSTIAPSSVRDDHALAWAAFDLADGVGLLHVGRYWDECGTYADISMHMDEYSSYMASDTPRAVFSDVFQRTEYIESIIQSYKVETDRL